MGYILFSELDDVDLFDVAFPHNCWLLSLTLCNVAEPNLSKLFAIYFGINRCVTAIHLTDSTRPMLSFSSLVFFKDILNFVFCFPCCIFVGYVVMTIILVRCFSLALLNSLELFLQLLLIKPSLC